MKIKRKNKNKEEAAEMEEEEGKTGEASLESLLREDFDEEFDMKGFKASFAEAGADVDLSIPVSNLEKQTLLEETYPLIDPFAYCLIQTDPQTKQTRYVVVETPLSSKEEEILRMVREIMVEELDIDFSVLKDKQKASEYLRKKLIEIVKDYSININDEGFNKIFYYITRDFVGMGSIEPLLKDHMIEDISCDGVGIPIYIWHRKYESIPANVAFNEAEELDSLIIKMAQRSGRHISVASPLLDASLPDGSRIQLTFGKEVTQRGSTFTIRKFRADPLTISDLLAFNTLDPMLAAFFWFTIEHRISVLVAGGVASGKTTLLNCLSMFIKPDLKIISIEDTAELNIPHQNWIPSVARTGFGGAGQPGGRKRGEITMFDLLKAALRQRPDYIVVGEIRGAESYTLFQALSVGHGGLSTMHSDSVEGVIRRLESEPMNIPRAMLQALDLVAIQRKVRYRGRHIRRAIVVQEIVGTDPVTNELITNKLFAWNPKEDTFTFFGRSYTLEEISENTGMSEKDIWDEIERRKTVLRWMVKKRISNYLDVGGLIREYYSNPEEMHARAVRELI